MTLRNFWRRKANQLESIFSATDSVLLNRILGLLLASIVLSIRSDSRVLSMLQCGKRSIDIDTYENMRETQTSAHVCIVRVLYSLCMVFHLRLQHHREVGSYIHPISHHKFLLMFKGTNKGQQKCLIEQQMLKLAQSPLSLV